MKIKLAEEFLRIGENFIPYKVFIASEGEKTKLKVQVFSENKKLARKVVNKVKEIYRVNFDYRRLLLKTRKLQSIK